MNSAGRYREIVICATQRCGSTLLCNDLANNGLGRPEEHFLPLLTNGPVHKAETFMAEVMRRGTSENGTFAVKIMASYANAIDDFISRQHNITRPSQIWPNLAAQFRSAYWIFISRQDHIAQAVSRLMSQVTGINHAVLELESDFVPGRSIAGSSETYNANVALSDDQICKTVTQIEQENACWEQFFSVYGIAPRRILYEEILDDFSHIEVIRKDLDLSESALVKKRNLIKLGNTRSEKIATGFKERNLGVSADKKSEDEITNLRSGIREETMESGENNVEPLDLRLDEAAVQKISQRWVSTPYYDAVEHKAPAQWKSLILPFLSSFADIDWSHVLEIAVGHGRMTRILLETAQRVTGVDVLKENIDFCANRFEREGRLHLIQTDGVTLKEIPSSSISFVFCFDSMVHFDSDVVRSYIRECRRVLQPGGYFFAHHSNLTRNPEGDFQRAAHARNFMSEALFRHFSKKEGMSVSATKIIDWGEGEKRFEGLDCLSLLRKI